MHNLPIRISDNNQPQAGDRHHYPKQEADTKNALGRVASGRIKCRLETIQIYF